MLFNSFLILFLTKLICFVNCKNYTGHSVYKVYAKNLIHAFTDNYLDEDQSIILPNGSIPLPKHLFIYFYFLFLLQGIEPNGDQYAIVHVEPNKNKRFKRDLNYQLLNNDLNQWISGNFRPINQPVIVFLDNYPLLKQSTINNQHQLTSYKALDSSESNLYQSYLNPNYDSFWSFIQQPFRSLAQLTNWNSPLSNWNLMQSSLDQSSNINSNLNSIKNQDIDYKESASSGAISHASQEESSVYLSAFVPNFRLDIYHNLDEIYDYLERLANMHKHILIYTIGYSHESRPIKAIEIHQDKQNLNKKMVYLDGLIHAREHITTAAILNIIEQILIRKIECNFLIVPIINVDGYVYTWTTDRLWRKNRRKVNSANNSFLNTLRSRLSSERCNGVDLNRNFDINFGGVGSSLNPCSELYAGPSAFSEPETASLARLLYDNRHRIKLFISLHSFGQLWSAPISYSRQKSPHHDLHMSVLKEVQNAVFSVNSVLYNVGPLGASLYLGSGYSLDYTYEKLNVVHSYLVEVRDKGEYGFLLPADQILPTSFEILEGLIVSIKRAYH